MLRNFRKPLVIASPKIGLKHPLAVSKVEEMLTGTTFNPIYKNEFGQGKINKTILCSGKVYFDIQQALSGEQGKNLKHKVQVIRVEELAPFPIKLIENVLQSTNAKESDIIWV